MPQPFNNLNTLDGGISHYSHCSMFLRVTSLVPAAVNFLRTVCNLMTSDFSALDLVSLTSAYMFSVAGGIQMLLVLA